MKRLSSVLIVLLSLLFVTTSCQKNYNEYRNLVYGTWRLVSVNGVTDTSVFVQDTLAFTSSTAVTLTRNSSQYTGQYSFYTNVLTTYFSSNIDLYQEWLVENMKDSSMRAVIQVKEGEDAPNAEGDVLEFIKLP